MLKSRRQLENTDGRQSEMHSKGTLELRMTTSKAASTAHNYFSDSPIVLLIPLCPLTHPADTNREESEHTPHNTGLVWHCIVLQSVSLRSTPDSDRPFGKAVKFCGMWLVWYNSVDPTALLTNGSPTQTVSTVSEAAKGAQFTSRFNTLCAVGGGGGGRGGGCRSGTVLYFVFWSGGYRTADCLFTLSIIIIIIIRSESKEATQAVTPDGVFSIQSR